MKVRISSPFSLENVFNKKDKSGLGLPEKILIRLLFFNTFIKSDLMLFLSVISPSSEEILAVILKFLLS